jgi:hypothetical protein
MLMLLEQQMQSNALLSHDLLLALIAHVLRGAMRSREAQQQQGRIAGLQRGLHNTLDEQTRHDLLVLLQQTDAALARVAQAATQQRNQARAQGLNPDGILAAAARWHVRQRQQEVDSWLWDNSPLLRLVMPEAAAIETTEEIIRHGGADLLAALDHHPAVAAFLINNALLTIPYQFCGKQRRYQPDAIVRLATKRTMADDQAPPWTDPLTAEPLIDHLMEGKGLIAVDDEVGLDATFCETVFVVVEVRRSRDVRDQAQAEAAERWCAAMSADGRWGRWVYLLCSTVEELPARLDALAATYTQCG